MLAGGKRRGFDKTFALTKQARTGSLPRVNSKAFVRFSLQVALASVAFSCSLIASTKNEQCRTDGDCATFPGYTCDLGDHVCVRLLGAGGDGAGGIDDPEGRDASVETDDAESNDVPAGTP